MAFKAGAGGESRKKGDGEEEKKASPRPLLLRFRSSAAFHPLA